MSCKLDVVSAVLLAEVCQFAKAKGETSRWSSACVGLVCGCLWFVVVPAASIVSHTTAYLHHRTMGKSEMPTCPLFPTLNMSQQGQEPFAQMKGPMCFGGLLECCCSFEFPIKSTTDGHNLAKVTKCKPQGGAGVMREAFTSADNYTIEFQDASLTPEQKAIFLGSQLLADYMLFENKADKCGVEDGQFYLNLTNCYFLGMTCPCKLKGGGEGG